MPSKRMFAAFMLLILIVGMTALSGPAAASQHLMFIDEIFPGSPAEEDARFIELRMYSGGQNQVDGTQIRLYDEDGDLQDTETFTEDVVNDDKGDSILIATPDAATLFDITPDLSAPSLGIFSSGKACFTFPNGSAIDCVIWGDYTEPLGGDVPFNKPEGLVSGASFQRIYGGNGIGSEDDDTSRAELRLDSPDPRNNAGDEGASFQRLRFFSSIFEVPEDAISVGLIVSRDGGNSGTAGVSFSTTDASATAPDDYTESDEELELADNAAGVQKNVPIIDDSEFEGPETILLTLRSPTGGPMLDFPMNAKIRITDYEDDDEAPRSRVRKPDHGESYRRAKLTVIKGTATDGVGDISGVKMGLRKTMTNGTCRWYNGNGFVQQRCSNKRFVNANGAEQWKKNVGLLAKSVGTNVKFYTAFSQAKDLGDNSETGFEKGRNSNRFEIK